MAIDALIVISGPPLVTRAEDVATAIMTRARRLPRPLPVMAVFMSAGPPPAELRGDELTIPSYQYPENAAHALGHAFRYGRWRATPAGEVPAFSDIRREEAAAAVDAMLAVGQSRWLDPHEVRTLLDCHGFPLVEQVLVRTPAEPARPNGPATMRGAE